MFVSTPAKIKIFGVAYSMFHNIPGVTKIPIGRRFEQVAACFIMYLVSPKYLPADILHEQSINVPQRFWFHSRENILYGQWVAVPPPQRFWFHSRENILYDQWATVSPKVLIPFQRKHPVWSMSYCVREGFDSIPEKTSCINYELLWPQRFWFHSGENIMYE